MDKIFNVAIIGGGASGLVCACELCSKFGDGSSVIILEGQDRVGKKLIATGNGQCNLGNANFGAEYYHGDKRFIEKFIENAKSINLDEYLYSLGIPIITEQNGKKYPVSKQASAVLDTLRERISAYNVCTKTSFKVSKIIKKDQLFAIYSGDEKILAKNVVIATGGSAGKQFGTDGSAYALAERFGHTKGNLYPSLVQLKTCLDKIKGLKGIKEYAKVTAYSDGKALSSAVGDVLFTEFGVSGSAIFSVSSYVVDKKSAKLKIEFLPDFTFEQTQKIIEDRKKYSPTETGEKTLNCIINKRIGSLIYKFAGTDDASVLATALKNFELEVTGTLGFNYAQVTKGGINTDEIYPDTYQSKFKNGLYLIGEILNVDGDCGGYNLAFAFASGILAARAIEKDTYKKKV